MPELDLVIQYSAPQELCNYYHRIGRTARAGAKGSAIIFLSSNEEKFVEFLQSKNVEYVFDASSYLFTKINYFKSLRIKEDDYLKSLKEVQLPNMNIRVYEEKIITLQRKLEDLLSDDEELRIKASRGERNIFYISNQNREVYSKANYRGDKMFNIIL